MTCMTCKFILGFHICQYIPNICLDKSICYKIFYLNALFILYEERKKKRPDGLCGVISGHFLLYRNLLPLEV